MKTVITATGNQLQSKFDRRFGRAAWFCVYNEDTKTTEFHENKHLNDSKGVGTKTAEKMFTLKADKVISGDFGPKAKDLLDKFNIQMVIIQDDDVSVENIIEKIK